MFSQKIHFEIARVTQKALETLHSQKAIDQVTIILGYEQLSSRKVGSYDAKLRPGIARLLELARLENQQELNQCARSAGSSDGSGGLRLRRAGPLTSYGSGRLTHDKGHRRSQFEGQSGPHVFFCRFSSSFIS
jgi:hypothetical protein